MIAVEETTELRARADANFCEMFRILARGASGGAAREIAGASLIATGVPISLFNPVFLADAGALAAVVADAREFYHARRLPWALVVPEQVPVARGRLAEAGLWESQAMPVFARETLPGSDWPVARVPLEIHAGDTPGVLADHRALLEAAFGIPERMSRMVLADGPRDERLRLYVAYDSTGTPVGSAALCAAAGVAGVYNVGVEPTHRREGIATALIRRVLADARERALETCVLQSSPEGRPLYARLGFTRLSTYTIYVDDDH